MPTYLDIHDIPGVTAEAVAGAHEADVRVQGQYGVNWQTIRTTATGLHAAAFTNGLMLVGGEKGIESVSLANGFPTTLISQLRAGAMCSLGSSSSSWAR